MKTSFPPKMVNRLMYALVLMAICSNPVLSQVCETELIWSNYQGDALPNDLDYSVAQDAPLEIIDQTITLVNNNSEGSPSPFNNTIFSGAIGTVLNSYVLSINGNADDQVTQKTLFHETIYDLKFSILDIDRHQNGHWQDWVNVKVYSGAFKYNITNDNIINSGASVSFDDATDAFLGTFEVDNATGVAGNVELFFPGAVDSVIIDYTYGPLSQDGELGIQIIGLSNLNFKSSFTCVGPTLDNANACLDFQSSNNEIQLLESLTEGSAAIDNNSLQLLTNPKNGTATLINSNGSVIYSTQFGFSGLDSMQYQICDFNAMCTDAWLYVIVNSDGAIIQSMDDHYPLLAKTSISSNVLDNDMNLDLGTISVETSQTINPTNGAFSLNSDGSFSYTPNENFVGHDSAKYTICHSSGSGICKEASINFYVKPIVIPGAYSVVDFYDEIMIYKNTKYTGSVANNIGFIGGSTPAFTYVLHSNPTNGVASVTADGVLCYTPNSEYEGTDVLSYERFNNQNSDTEIVNISVKVLSEYTDCNFSLPIANDDFSFTCENQSVSGNVASNDSSNMPSQSSASVTLLSGVSNGTLILNESGDYIYYPNTDSFGSDEFTYEICFFSLQDNKNNSEFMSNDVPKTLPVGVGTIYSAVSTTGTGEITKVSVENLEISHGDIGELSVKLIAPSGQSAYIFKNICSSYGNLKLNFSDSATQTTVSCPPTNNAFYKPFDSFSKFNTEDPNGTWFIQLIDNNHPQNAGILESWNIVLETSVPESLGCRQASVKLLVMPKVVAPTPIDDCVETSAASPVDINAIDNDTDEDGDMDPRSISISTNPTNGTASVNVDGSIRYQPNLGFAGTDYIQYSICDTTMLCSTAEIKVIVSTVLAVDFTDFNVTLDRSDNPILDWSIAEGHTAGVFEVQRSTDGSFEVVSSVDASADYTDYQFIDEAVSASGKVYYRIKTIELNGKTSYTDVKSVMLNLDSEVLVYPNPFTDNIWIDIEDSNDNVKLELFDSNGNVLFKSQVSTNTQLAVDQLNLPKGIYVLKVSSKTISQSVKMLKL